MARVEAMPEDQDHDLGLVRLWIAFNSLYGRWDSGKREPKPDRESRRLFIDRILKLDRDGHVAAMLQEHKRLALTGGLATVGLKAIAGVTDPWP